VKGALSSVIRCVALGAAAGLVAAVLQAQEQQQTSSAPLPALAGPSDVITTVAGDGYLGDVGNGGRATHAQFVNPVSAAVDAEGNLYISDAQAQVVRKVSAATGVISAFAGTGRGGYSGDDGPAIKAELNVPQALAIDSRGNLYIADSRNNVIRKVNLRSGIITTAVGTGLGTGAGGSNLCSSTWLTFSPTPARYTSLCQPVGLAVDGHNNLYLTDFYSDVRMLNVATDEVTTVASTGGYGYAGDGGSPIGAKFSFIEAVAADKAGDIYIADTGNCAIRKISASTGLISSLVGTPEPGGTSGVCGLAGDGGPASSARISGPWGVAVVFIADSYNYLVRFVSAANGNIYTAAGSYETLGSPMSGIAGYSGDGGPATKATLNFPTGIGFDVSGNLYFADTINNVIRKVTAPTVLPSHVPFVQGARSQGETPTEVRIAPPVPGGSVVYTSNGPIPMVHSIPSSGPFK
jgi:hypothetical protein